MCIVHVCVRCVYMLAEPLSTREGDSTVWLSYVGQTNGWNECLYTLTQEQCWHVRIDDEAVACIYMFIFHSVILMFFWCTVSLLTFNMIHHIHLYIYTHTLIFIYYHFNLLLHFLRFDLLFVDFLFYLSYFALAPTSKYDKTLACFFLSLSDA